MLAGKGCILKEVDAQAVFLQHAKRAGGVDFIVADFKIQAVNEEFYSIVDVFIEDVGNQFFKSHTLLFWGEVGIFSPPLIQISFFVIFYHIIHFFYGDRELGMINQCFS